MNIDPILLSPGDEPVPCIGGKITEANTILYTHE